MSQQFILNLKEIITKAGEISIDLRNKGLIIEKKIDDSPVTNADLAISNYIYSNLEKFDKNIPIICEEQPLRDVSTKEMFWLVDPIDGTKSYIKNMDSFTVNIALIRNQIPIIGLVYQPTTKKLYFTDHQGKLRIEIKGKDYPITTRNDGDYIAIVSSRHLDAVTEKYIKGSNFSKVISVASSIKLCMVAEGVGDVYPKFGSTMEWDTAAGHAIVSSSGGVVIDANSKTPLLYGKNNFQNPDFLALNKRLVGVAEI